jgi:hypothetical protein
MAFSSCALGAAGIAKPITGQDLRGAVVAAGTRPAAESGARAGTSAASLHRPVWREEPRSARLPRASAGGAIATWVKRCST